MLLTVDDLKKLLPGIKKPADFIGPLNDLLPVYEITTTNRLAAFFAQTGHESASYNSLEEKASGSAYEMRKDLGNNWPGDGKKYKGRGILQITGKANYTAFGQFAKVDLLKSPERLKEPFLAVLAACWYWRSRKLNLLADDGNFDAITKIVNGGFNGKPERDKRWKANLAYLAEK